MLFGHNSNVKVGERLYHVQTEDRGTSHAVIDTMVYHSGRVLHRRATSYAALLPRHAAGAGFTERRWSGGFRRARDGTHRGRGRTFAVFYSDRAGRKGAACVRYGSALWRGMRAGS